ncbi:Slc8a3 [Symbiodinium natans]|uniref:Slc8a3 protein n=1 Tax=Symbiodinium natans TaxID=878477 RepID=A0A812TNY0_9DINO|nr:Slc8a3 [Symbiodinium natans]
MSACQTEVKICEPGGGGILLPLFGDDEQEWRKGLRAVLYLLGLLWLFMAVATVSDIFMGAIEEITSKKKRVLNASTGRYFTVKVWNDTVANLTLMALGSSAPEILLSVIELLGNSFYSGDLGPSTIVGSAAFNLFCISAVCVMAIPDNEVRYIKETNVYLITAVISLLAYLWLYLVVSVISEDMVDIFEGILTFLYFPMLVALAFAADKGYITFIKRTNSDNMHIVHKGKLELSDEDMARMSKADGMQISDEELAKYIGTESQRMSKAAYRKRAHDQVYHGKPAEVAKQRNHNFSAVVPAEEPPLSPSGGYVAPPTPAATVLFGGENFAVLETVGLIKVPVRRTGNLSLSVHVDYSCRDGTAKKGEDYEAVEGTMTFLPQEAEKTIDIKIMKDDVPEDSEDFFVDLTNVRCACKEGFAALGPVSTARVVIVDTDEPSVIYTDDDVVQVDEVSRDKEVRVTVRRRDGCGVVSCKYVTEDGSAVEGRDYARAEGMITFGQQEFSTEVAISILASATFEDKEDFRLILSDATGRAGFDPNTDGGADSCIVTLVLTPVEVSKNLAHRTMRALGVNWQKTQKGHENWKDQFINSLLVNGGDDEAGPPSGFQWALHLLTLPWKLLFAIIPPVDYCGGWLCFFVSLMFIGLVTALISDLAGLVGCVLDMPDFITAITLVALGTSLPDTFASKAAAEQDPYADASIGNVTGSNSVNVFLGLGLPWTIGSCYWASVGRTAEWQKKYQSEANFDLWNSGDGKFIVIGGDLGYSVVIFSVGAFFCMFVLFLRRKVFGGELGGPRVCKHITSVILVMVWCVYVILSSVKSLESAAAEVCR